MIYLFRRLRRLFPRRCLYCGVRVWREPDWRDHACQECIPF